MAEDALNECEEGKESRLWWERVQRFLEYRKLVGMTPADVNGVWLIPELYGLSGRRRVTPRQIAARTAFTEQEVIEMRDYIAELIRVCVPINVKA
jgi:hypothetical protein